MNKISFRNGVRDGIPIALGYFAVSFTFGIMAIQSGLTAWQAVLISITNLTSAGQFAGIGIIAAGGAAPPRRAGVRPDRPRSPRVDAGRRRLPHRDVLPPPPLPEGHRRTEGH